MIGAVTGAHARAITGTHFGTHTDRRESSVTWSHTGLRFAPKESLQEYKSDTIKTLYRRSIAQYIPNFYPFVSSCGAHGGCSL